MGDKLKKILFLTFFLVLYLNTFGEIKYKVSGKVLREGAGVKGIDVRCFPIFESDDFNLADSKDQECITDKNGQFAFYLKPGKYHLICGINNPPPGELDTLEDYKEIVVVDKNIKNIIFELYTPLEIINANLNILEEIPDTTPTVNYRWGRVPIQSLEECRLAAEDEFADFKDESEILMGAKIGPPVIFYDLKDNPGCYQFPIVNFGVEVGYIGIDAMRLEPVENGYGYLGITLNELKASAKTMKGQKATAERFVPDAIEWVAEKKGCNKEDITLLKLLCLTAIKGGNLYAMLRIIPTDKIIVVNLSSRDILTDRYTLAEIQEYTEDGVTLWYIKEYKKVKNIPLMH
jgi:hypothetical protein